MKACAILLFAWSACAQSVWFEPNRGQVAGRTEWIGRSKGAYLYITSDEVVYANKNVHMRLVGASKRAAVEGMEPTGGYSSYFMGRDEKTWFTGIPHYARLRYQDVYPGVDMVYYGSGRNVEYDFVVKAGADPDRIELAFSEPVKIDGGDLIVTGLRQHRPKVLQDGREIAAAYRIIDSTRVQLAFAKYDRSRQLDIDPVLEFSTYLGGPGEDHATGVVVDGSGNVVIAGGTQSPATPSLDPFQQPNLVGSQPFVLKLSPDGRRVIYFTVISSGGYDEATAVTLDSSGSPIVVGLTISASFPTKNAFQTELRSAYATAFVTKLSADGKALLFSSYLGGSVGETPNAVISSSDANVFVAGTTRSHDFPVKAAIQPTFGGGYSDWFITKISSTGQMLASTYIGGGQGLSESCESATFGPDGNLLLAGTSSAADFPLKRPVQTTLSPTGYATPVLVKMTPDLQTILVSPFFGGGAYGDARAIASDTTGNIWIGGAAGPNLAITSDAVQSTTQGGSASFLAQIDSEIQHLQYVTYFGSGSTAAVTGVAIDKNGFVHVSGSAANADFPSKNALQNWLGGGIRNADCFAAEFAPTRMLIYSTPLGGTGNEFCGPLSIDNTGNVYVVGDTYSIDFPLKNAYQPSFGGSSDGFLAKLSDVVPPLPSPLTITPAQLLFRYVQGDPAPAPRIVTVSGPAYTVKISAPWLNAATGTGGLSISVNPAMLTPGMYSATVTLTPSAGTSAAVDVGLTVLAPAPILTRIEPALVAVAADDTSVTIRGSGFTSGAVLQVDGLPWTITPVRFVDSSTLQFSMPRAYFSVQFNHTIAVQNPNSALSNVLSLAVGAPAPYFTAASVTNAGSYTTGAVAPGEIITIFGTNLDPRVTFDDIPATLVYSSATQVSVTVPYSIVGPTTTVRSGSSAPVTPLVAPSAPGIFAAVADPANAGIVTLYATGCGTLTSDSLPRCALPVYVSVNGQPADVLYAGVAPGLVEGADQINIRLPDGIGPGALHIVLQAGDAASKEFLFSLP